MAKQLYFDFDEYIRQGEPEQQAKAENWSIAIGLQAVDGLQTSQYLQETAKRNIEGEISLDEAQGLIHNYYVSKQNRETPEEYKEQPRLDMVETEQAPNKYRTSTEQVPNKLVCNNPNIIKLIRIIGNKECSIKQMMENLALKHRPNFLDLYLSPAMSEGYVRMLYPDSPRHPRQRYLLTVKGQMIQKEDNA